MKHIIYPLITICFISCIKDVKIEDVFEEIKSDKMEIVADGQSTSIIKLILNKKASPDRKNVLFSTDRGVFTSTGENKATVKASFEDGKLIAKITLRAPKSAGKITVIAKPEFDSSDKEFSVSVFLEAVESEANQIKLDQSALGIGPNFIEELRIWGVLNNSQGRPVSDGVKVVFEDFLVNGNNANGEFRSIIDIKTDSSIVSCKYGANTYSIGTKIKILCTVLDIGLKKTSIKDSIYITINK
jgi:hypothetical protein